MQRAMGFILVVCLLILSVSCSQPTALEPWPAPKILSQSHTTAPDEPSEEPGPAPKVLSQSDAEFYLFSLITEAIFSRVLPVLIEDDKTIKEGKTIIKGVVTSTTKVSGGEMTVTLKNFPTEHPTLAVSGEFSTNEQGFVSMNVTVKNRRLIVDNQQWLNGKSIVLQIDGVKYRYTFTD